MRVRIRLMCGLAAAALALPACGVSNFICRREAIRATLEMPRVPGEDALSETMAGNFEADRDENPELTAIHAALEGRSLAGRGIAIWLQRGLDHTLNLTLHLPTPLRVGDVLAVAEVHSPDRPLWGTVPNAPRGLSVGVRLDDFLATSATGSARVLGLDPLRMEIDVVAAGSGRQVAIDGRLTLGHETWTESCFQ